MKDLSMTESSPAVSRSYADSTGETPTPAVSPIVSLREPSLYPAYDFGGTENYIPRLLVFTGQLEDPLKKFTSDEADAIREVAESGGDNFSSENLATMQKVYKALMANTPGSNHDVTPALFPSSIWSQNFQSSRNFSLSGCDQSEVASPIGGDSAFEPNIDPNYVLHSPQPSTPCQVYNIFMDEDDGHEFFDRNNKIMAQEQELVFRDQNGRRFVVPADSRFFVIKSNNFLDIFASFKNKVWSSTEMGNKRLNRVFQSLRRSGKVFLFYLVNGSGQFCGISQMCDEVDYSQSCNIWVEQTKYRGVFPVDWLMVKNIPNKFFNHLRIPDNDNKAVTCSRDTQEIPYDVGIAMLKIFSSFRLN